MTTAVVAKMICQETATHSTYGGKPQHKVKLGAIYDKEGENKDFSDATPSGECWMMINDGRAAHAFFKAGKKYYITFTEAAE